MNQVELNVKTRETGKQISKEYRREGLVPGVYYSKGVDSIPILADPLTLRPIIYTSQTRIVNLKIEGQDGVKECVLKDVVFDPVTDQITHFDLYGIIRGQKLTVDIPVSLKGSPVGVREGGILQQIVHRLTVYCLPKYLPSSIELDISNLRIGDALLVRDVSLENVEIDLPDDAPIVSVVKPRVSTTKAEAGEEAIAGEEAEAGEETEE